jgi:hypothetical protein
MLSWTHRILYPTPKIVAESSLNTEAKEPVEIEKTQTTTVLADLSDSRSMLPDYALDYVSQQEESRRKAAEAAEEAEYFNVKADPEIVGDAPLEGQKATAISGMPDVEMVSASQLHRRKLAISVSDNRRTVTPLSGSLKEDKDEKKTPITPEQVGTIDVVSQAISTNGESVVTAPPAKRDKLEDFFKHFKCCCPNPFKKEVNPTTEEKSSSISSIPGLSR